MSNGSNDLEGFTINEVAAFWKVHRSTLYRLIKANKIGYFRAASNRIRFRREHLEEFLQRNERNGRGRKR